MSTQSPNAGLVIFAKDIESVAKFYQVLLSLSVIDSTPDHIVLESEYAALVIHGIPAQISEQIVITKPPKVRDAMALKPFFIVANIETARDIVVSLGGQVEPSAREWSTRNFKACDCYDPEGNVIQLRQKVA